MYTIKDLSEGKCAVMNDGTLEELRIVLQAAFPNDFFAIKGKFKYYSQYLYEPKYWSAVYFTPLLTQSVKDFIKQIQPTMMEKKIIGYKLIKPEYEQAAVLICKAKGATDVDDFKPNYVNGCAFKKDARCTDWLAEAGVLDLWFEPVYEQLLKEGDWIVVTKEYKNNSAKEGHICKLKSVEKNAIPEYEVVDVYDKYNWAFKTTWVTNVRLATTEEIEKASTKAFTMTCQGGSFELEVSPKGIYYKTEDTYLNANIRWSDYDIENSLPTNRSTYKMKVTKIDVGCKKDTLISEWIEVYNYYKSVKA